MIYIIAAYLPVCVFGGGLLIHGLVRLKRESRYIERGKRIDNMLERHRLYRENHLDPIEKNWRYLDRDQRADFRIQLNEWIVWGEAIKAERKEWQNES